MGRVFGFLSVVVAVGVGMYIYSAQMKNAAAPAGGTNPVTTVNITGVRSDLLSIASAERQYYASQGKYASLDELIAGNYITIKGSRPPYTYDIESSDTGFHVTATRGPSDAPGGPAKLWIDETMQISSSE